MQTKGRAAGAAPPKAGRQDSLVLSTAEGNPEGEGFNNLTRAAKLAGYSMKAAGQIGHANMKKHEIRREIERALDEAGATPEKIAQVLKKNLDAKSVRVFLPKGSRSPVYSKALEDGPTQVRAAEVVSKIQGDVLPQRTIERRELLQIQQTILIVPPAQPDQTAIETKPIRVVDD